MTKDRMIGVDLAKAVFQVHGAAITGQPKFRKKLSRQGFSKFMADPNGQNDRTDLDQENQLRVVSIEARESDLDLVRRSPYRPAASENAAFKGLTEDRTRSLAHSDQKLLASRAATTGALM